MLAQKPPIRVICPGRTYRLRQRPDPHADVPPGRRPGRRQGLPSRPPEMDSGGILQGVLRGRRREDAVPAVVLPVHRAVARGRHPVPPRQGRDQVRRGRRLAGDSRLRHGASERAAQLRHRSRPATRASPGAWGSTASPCSNTACHDLRGFFEADVRWLTHYGFRPLDFPTLGGRAAAHEIHPVLAQGPSRHRPNRSTPSSTSSP